MIHTHIDPKFKVKKIEEFIDFPVIVKVNKFDEASAKEFNDHFAKATNTGQPVIPVVIDSYGGQVYSLLAMVETIKSSKLPVATIIQGKAMSCGAILFSCGTEGMRYMGEHATLMIHDVSSWAVGKIEEIKADAAEAERLNKYVYHLISKNVGKPENYFLDIVHSKGHADWYLTAQEAQSHNLCNKIGLPKMKVDLKIDVSFG